MTTLNDLEGRATITVPEAGQLLGIGRDAAYAAAERGEIPVLHLGRRLVVPVPRLLQLLGCPQTDSEAGLRQSPTAANDSTPHQESRHGHDDPQHARAASIHQLHR